MPRRSLGVTLAGALRRRRLALAAGGLAVVAAMAFSMLDQPVLTGHHIWLVAYSSDLWGSWQTAATITHADRYPYVFVDDSALRNAPGWILLISPIARLGASLPYPPDQLQPAAWWLAGPVYLAPIVFFCVAADRWMQGVPRARRLAAFAAAAVLLPSTALWGHPEDLVAIAATLYALRAAVDGRPNAAGWWLSLALAMQLEAVLLIPLCLAVLPARRWRAVLGRAAIAPVAVLIEPLWGTPSQTLSALAQHDYLLTARWGSPLLRLFPATLDGVLRFPIIAGAVAIAVVVARRPGPPERWLWAAGVVLALRCFELGLYPYYLTPALAVLVVSAARRSAWRAAGALALGVEATWQLHFAFNRSWWYWLAFLGVTTALALLAHPGRHGVVAAPESALPPGDILEPAPSGLGT